MKRLDTESGPECNKDKTVYDELEQAMGFKYGKLLGELLFCVVTCRPDISFTEIKLAKFANYPSSIRYQALKKILRCLHDTLKDGIHFWGTKKHYNYILPASNLP